jgi:hypothetical protein
MAVVGHVFESCPWSPSLAHAKVARWSGMHPPFTQTWPAAQLAPPSADVLHGGTQWPSTQVAPPWQLDAPEPEHGPGFRLHTPRVKSHP